MEIARVADGLDVAVVPLPVELVHDLKHAWDLGCWVAMRMARFLVVLRSALSLPSSRLISSQNDQS